MKKLLSLIILFGLSTVSVAQERTLQAAEFKDQWDKSNPLTVSTRWMIFSAHRKGGEMVKDTLLNLKLTNLADQKGLYVADISGMPRLISKFIALPKMRDYPFRVALATSAEVFEHWPQKENRVSVIRLNNLAVTEVEYFSDQSLLEIYMVTVLQE